MDNSVPLSDIGIVILAAGSSKRFGGDKRNAVLANGRSVLENTLSSIPSSFTKRILVLKKEDEQLALQFQQHWQICIAEAPETGMANSLTTAIEHCEGWQGALIALADMPFIPAKIYTDIQKALTERDIVIPVHTGRRGNPVAFNEKYFPEIRRLTGDQGAKPLLQKYSDKIHELEVDDTSIFRDIDVPEDTL